ncbi:hypothetical protein ACMGE0_31190, partial [Neorhizobium sp. DT-125]
IYPISRSSDLFRPQGRGTACASFTPRSRCSVSGGLRAGHYRVVVLLNCGAFDCSHMRMKAWGLMAGNDDMANGNDHRVHTDAVTAKLGEQVTNLGRRRPDMESEMRAGFKAMEAAVTSLVRPERRSLPSTNLAERNKPQWQALSVALAFAALVGEHSTSEFVGRPLPC